MAIDIGKETVIPGNDIGRYLPSSRRGKRLSPAQINRFFNKGVGPHRIKLESFTVGRTRLTSVEAIQRFVERLNAGASDERPGMPVTSRRASARAARAARELDRLL